MDQALNTQQSLRDTFAEKMRRVTPLGAAALATALTTAVILAPYGKIAETVFPTDSLSKAYYDNAMIHSFEGVQYDTDSTDHIVARHPQDVLDHVRFDERTVTRLQGYGWMQHTQYTKTFDEIDPSTLRLYQDIQCAIIGKISTLEPTAIQRFMEPKMVSVLERKKEGFKGHPCYVPQAQ